MTGRSHRFLEEHLANGLPDESELAALAAGLPLSVRLELVGDRERAARLFEARTLARARPTPRHPGYGFMNWYLNRDRALYSSAPASALS